MKLKCLEIERLYGSYNYKVQFNSDVTFIYGKNGCGKTTILNITEAIITGKIYQLFELEFSRIQLDYINENEEEKLYSIRIINNEYFISIEYKGKTWRLTKLDYDKMKEQADLEYELEMMYNRRYAFLEDLKTLFNNVYLPLNRTMTIPSSRAELLRRTMRHGYTQIGNNMSSELAIYQVEEMIKRKYQEIMTEISNINNDFRNKILKSLVEVKSSNYSNAGIVQMIKENSSEEVINSTRTKYIALLEALQLLTEYEKEGYNLFFDTFIKQLKEVGKDNKGFSFNMFLQYQEINKIRVMIGIAEEMEKRKAEANEPIDIFINTVNEFISDEDDGKEIGITKDGLVYFKTKNSFDEHSISALSSGEKQLITFFANLIFMADRKSSGIFVVDEPELSLHLSWQKMFVDKMMMINPHIQLIFATHAPEIIGHYRNKMFKLHKEYSKS